jgi:hypothetical protein
LTNNGYRSCACHREAPCEAMLLPVSIIIEAALQLRVERDYDHETSIGRDCLFVSKSVPRMAAQYPPGPDHNPIPDA